jgi:hypothetical protein
MAPMEPGDDEASETINQRLDTLFPILRVQKRLRIKHPVLTLTFPLPLISDFLVQALQ